MRAGKTLDFPDSVIKLFEGYLGQPYEGFPKELQLIVLKGREPITVIVSLYLLFPRKFIGMPFEKIIENR